MVLKKLSARAITIITLSLLLALLSWYLFGLSNRETLEYTISTKGSGDINFLSREINGEILFLGDNNSTAGRIKDKKVSLIKDTPKLPGEIITNAQWFDDNKKLLVELSNTENAFYDYPGYEYSESEYYYGIYTLSDGLILLPPLPKKVFVLESEIYGTLGDNIYNYRGSDWVDTGIQIVTPAYTSQNSKYLAIKEPRDLVILNKSLNTVSKINTPGTPISVFIFDNMWSFNKSSENSGQIIGPMASNKVDFPKMVGNQIFSTLSFIYRGEDGYVKYYKITENLSITINSLPGDLINESNTYIVNENKIIFTDINAEEIKVIEINT